MIIHLKDFLKLVGAREAIDGLIVLLFGYYWYNPGPESSPGLGILILLAIVFFIHTLNDIYDYDIDIANKRNKPLVQGLIPVSFARYLVIYLFFCSLLFGVLIPWLVVDKYFYIVLTVILLVIGFCYSYPRFNFSAKPVLAIITILIGSVFIPYYFGTYASTGRFNINLDDLIILCGLVFMAFGRVILKDIRDRIGDKAFGRNSLALILKTKNLMLISLAMFITGALTLLLELLKTAHSSHLYIFLTTAFCLYIIFVIFKQYKIEEEQQVATIRKPLVNIYMASRLYYLIILVTLYTLH